MTNIFHYTDTMRLPWILDDDKLRPGTASKTWFEEFPGLDCVWATTNPNGARSATAFWDNGRYRAGKVWAVRFVLDAADFAPWPKAALDWPPEVLNRFEALCQGDNPADFQTHPGSLGRSSWLGIEAKSYDCSGWRKLKVDMPVESRIAANGNPVKTVTFAGRMFTSMRIGENPMTYQTSIADMITGKIEM